MTTYLTATQAASRLGKSEKTIRRWITEGRLVAHHPNGRKNMLAISEDDIERLAQELAQYEQQPAAAASEDTSSLAEQLKQLRQDFENYQTFSYQGATPDFGDINHLENRLDALESRIAEIERILSVGTPAQPAAAEHTTRTRPRHAIASTAAIEPLEHLPQGSIPHYRFAEMHGVKPRTFLDHIHKSYVSSIARQKPNRKEISHWLSPEQQRQAISFWQANDTTYHTCDLCPHSDEIYQRVSEDQEQSSEDQQSAEAMI